MKRILQTLFLVWVLTGCAASFGSPLYQESTSSPTTMVLATVAADATATPTPFQPEVAVVVDTPFALETPTLEAASPTFDPNILLPTEATPDSIYVPPYAPPAATPLTDTQTVTYLLLGSDKRPGQTYFRTDTIIVAAIRPSTGMVSMISVPRDLYVYIPSVGMDRINAAYEYGIMYHYPGGGEGMVKATFLYNLGIRIDHLAIVDFDGFRRIVDTLGGIDVPVYCAYTDWHLIDPSYDPENENNWSLYTVGPGLVHMDGDLALWYARSRLRSSDFDRGRRSQDVIRALYQKALQVNAIGKIPQLYNDFQSTVITDLDLNAVLQLSPLTLHLGNANIRSFYIGRDYVTAWMTPKGASVQLPNGPAIQSMLQNALSPSPVTADRTALIVEVRNGTGNPGWDSLAAERLNFAGFNTRIAPADRQDYSASLLYDLGATPDMNRATSLLAVLGLPSSAFVSVPQQADVNYVLILGQDYQPCFNPVNVTP